MSKSSSAFYDRHIFFCLNQRSGDEACCASASAQAAFDHCKARIKQLGVAVPGGVRVNRAGCLGRCSVGPVAVVYPEGIWYSYFDLNDIDEIINSHLIDGGVVHRLVVDPSSGV